jgi:2-haloacid dehalogenase
MALSDVKALGFDVFGTVVDWRTGIATQAAEFFSEIGAVVDEWDFADSWRGLYEPAMEPCRKGQRPYVRLDSLHRETLEVVLARFGVDPSSCDRQKLDEFAFAWRRLEPWPDAIEGLQRLRHRYVLVPLSNGNIALLLEMAKLAGLPWDAILGSEVTRAYKPEPAAYLGTAEVLGIKPQQLCLVAAHNPDLKAAKECGLATAFIARPREHGPMQNIDLTAEGDWDLVADSMTELAALLGC